MSGSIDRNARANRKLWEEWSVGWLVSAIVNLLILVTAAIWLLPIERQSLPVSLIARVDTEEGDLDMLTDAADMAALDFGADLEVSRLEPIDTPQVKLDASLAGGTLGPGPGGWQGGAGSGGPGGGTEYFGTVAYGNRFVYILDKSGSMSQGGTSEIGSGSRFDRARYELLRSVDKLAPYQQFYVILFSDTTSRMFDDQSPSLLTIPATRENAQRLRQWLDQAEADGGTDPREALFLALSIAPDAVFLLSDGDFNSVANRKNHFFAGNPEAEELVERINGNRTPIHTFAYEDPTSKQRMEVLAQLSGGEYKYIPPVETVQREPARGRRRR